MLNELWKPVKDWEQYYEISNYGRVRRIRYDDNSKKEQYRLPYYLKPKKDKDGYLKYALCLKRKNKYYFAHRLVATHFIDNVKKKPCVNHKDGDKQNNYVNNLEWCSIRYNNVHALENGLRNMKNNKLSKEVYQYDMDGNLVNIFQSANDAKRITGYSQGHISECCRGEIKQYNGYIWKYKIKYFSTTIP